MFLSTIRRFFITFGIIRVYRWLYCARPVMAAIVVYLLVCVALAASFIPLQLGFQPLQRRLNC